MPPRRTGFLPSMGALLDDPMARMALRSRLAHPYWQARLHQFGARSMIHKPEWVTGHRHIAIGDYVIIGHGVRLAVEQQARNSDEPVIRIGDRVGIGRYCTVSAAEQVVIEDDVGIASFTTIIDNDHTWLAGRSQVLYNPLVTAPIVIGQGTWLAERVTVLGGTTIGRYCIVAPNSVVRGNVPDHSLAVGVPARVLRDGARRWASPDL